MFQSVVDVSMVYEINKLLKAHHLDCEVHTFSGCATCGLQLISLEEEKIDEVLQVINAYLRKKFLVATLHEDHTMLYINSKFDINY